MGGDLKDSEQLAETVKADAVQREKTKFMAREGKLPLTYKISIVFYCFFAVVFCVTCYYIFSLTGDDMPWFIYFVPLLLMIPFPYFFWIRKRQKRRPNIKTTLESVASLYESIGNSEKAEKYRQVLTKGK